jgi:hypothetical protein
MSMAWTILLALVTGTGGYPPNPALDRAWSAGDRTVRAQGPGQSRSLAFAKKTWHRACSGCWASDGLEEFDTEEVDETWMVHLDAIASVPGSWLFEAWSRSVSRPKDNDGISFPPHSHFPLRC